MTLADRLAALDVEASIQAWPDFANTLDQFIRDLAADYPTVVAGAAATILKELHRQQDTMTQKDTSCTPGPEPYTSPLPSAFPW